MVLNELSSCLANDDKLLGEIYRLRKDVIIHASDLAKKSSAGNVGVIYNNLTVLKALLERKMPTSATLSRHSSLAAKRLLKDNPDMSPQLRDYLTQLKIDLLAHSENFDAVRHDQEKIELQSGELAKKASTIRDGIYIYSFPTYLHFGTIEDENVQWLKIGSTRNSIWHRIVEQSRQTSMPEDPKLLRIYHGQNIDIAQVESKFHSTLERVGHERSSASRTRAGREWFATTLDAVDAIAELMGLEIEKYQLEQNPF